ncbi:hypothetical protein BDF20DRAFT_826359 [Mycotypha africana]|uniref:uncharacterized protein n=1 Tax=Mycotypha africana TaxID=64632 RepID=UPI002300078F|nr:uncharacterized protein BDF20DRAFT_826359 [Mycotypha africana]KAI8970405.1 hypothetical protein BDF20DRAFT_826359 [Mycotypha africana]
MSTTSSTSGTTSIVSRRILPARQTRTKVATYNDVINSSEEFLIEKAFINYYKRNSRDAGYGIGSKRAKFYKDENYNPSDSRAPKQFNTSTTFLTGFTYDIAMQRHFSLVRNEDHPENPWRTFKVFNIFEFHGLVQHCKRIIGRRATREEVLLAHNIHHYRKMRDTIWLKTRKEYLVAQNQYESIYLNCNSYDSALLAAGSLIEVTIAVIQRKIKNAFAIIRPPGHHATFDIAKGFCIFNNVAIASMNLVKNHGVKKVLIVDWDIHFGNGTQNIFAEDPNVLYLSLHRYEDSQFYPGDIRGAAENAGHGEGEVSAGFDAAVNDPIGNCLLTPAAYGQMTYMLKNIADGRLVLSLEGGYDLHSIALSAYECMQVLMGAEPDPIEASLAPQNGCIEAIDLVKRIQKKYWKCLQDEVSTSS